MCVCSGSWKSGLQLVFEVDVEKYPAPFRYVRGRPLTCFAGQNHCKPIQRKKNRYPQKPWRHTSGPSCCRKPRLRNHKFAGPKPIPKPIPNRYPTHWPPCRIQPAALQPSLELPTCTLCTTFVLKSCDCRCGAAKMYFVYYTILHLLALKSCDFRAGAAKVSCAYYWKVATFQLELPKCTLCTTLVLKVAISSWGWELAECTSHTTLVRKSRDFRARAAKTLQTDAEEKKPILTDTEA